jgi:hypothetical protein
VEASKDEQDQGRSSCSASAPQWTGLKPPTLGKWSRIEWRMSLDLEPSVKSRSPTSVGDWIVASVLIVKGEDFKIVNQPTE